MKINSVILSVAKNLSRMRVFNSDIRQRFLVVLLLGMTVMISTVFAADSTPSADIKAKLEDLKKEIASKAAKFKQDIDKKLKDKAYIGNVKTKSAGALTLATKNGPRIVNINQDSEFESKVKGKKLSQQLITQEDYLAALGDVDETQVLTAKKIILLPNPASESKTYLWGQILSISDKIVTLKDRNLKNVAVSLSKPYKVRVGDFVILTGTFGKNDIFDAQFLYIIPQGGILKPKKLATPSATIQSTPQTTSSAKPKSTTH